MLSTVPRLCVASFAESLIGTGLLEIYSRVRQVALPMLSHYFGGMLSSLHFSPFPHPLPSSFDSNFFFCLHFLLELLIASVPFVLSPGAAQCIYLVITAECEADQLCATTYQPNNQLVVPQGLRHRTAVAVAECIFSCTTPLPPPLPPETSMRKCVTSISV